MRVVPDELLMSTEEHWLGDMMSNSIVKISMADIPELKEVQDKLVQHHAVIAEACAAVQVSSAIFEKMGLDAKGRPVTAGGTHSRRMALFKELISWLKRKGHTEAANAVSNMDKQMRAWLNKVVIKRWVAPVSVQGGVIISNDPKKPPGGQSLHVDLKEVLGLAAFWGLDSFALNVVDGSDKYVAKAEAMLAKGMSAEEVATALPQLQVEQVQINAGEIVLMHGFTVHGGAKGVAGKVSLRAHWYLQAKPLAPKKKGGDTYPPSVHREINAKLGVVYASPNSPKAC